VPTPQKVEYKKVVGEISDVQREVSLLATQNWRPILMSASAAQNGPVAVTVLLEHVHKAS
jgi:hypothetical protein